MARAQSAPSSRASLERYSVGSTLYKVDLSSSTTAEAATAAAQQQQRLFSADRTWLMPTRQKKLLHATPDYKVDVELRDRLEEERRLQVKKDHEDHVQRLLAAMKQRDQKVVAQVKELASRKAAAQRKREAQRRARDAKHASAWVELRAKEDFKEGRVRDAITNAELLAERRRAAAERQREKNKRDLEVLARLRNEAGRLKRSVIHQIEYGDPHTAAAAELRERAAHAEAEFLRASAHAKQVAAESGAAQSEQDRQAAAQAARTAARRAQQRRQDELDRSGLKVLLGVEFGSRAAVMAPLAQSRIGDGRWP